MTADLADRAAIERGADKALTTGDLVVVGRLVLVPDVRMVEFAANGKTAGPTQYLLRDDGRTVHLYRLPAGWRP